MDLFQSSQVNADVASLILSGANRDALSDAASLQSAMQWNLLRDDRHVLCSPTYVASATETEFLFNLYLTYLMYLMATIVDSRFVEDMSPHLQASALSNT